MAECEALWRSSGDSWLGDRMCQDAWLDRDRGNDAAWKKSDEEMTVTRSENEQLWRTRMTRAKTYD